MKRPIEVQLEIEDLTSYYEKEGEASYQLAIEKYLKFLESHHLMVDWVKAEDFNLFFKEGDEYFFFEDIEFYGKIMRGDEIIFQSRLKFEDNTLMEYNLFTSQWESADVDIEDLTHCYTS